MRQLREIQTVEEKKVGYRLLFLHPTALFLTCLSHASTEHNRQIKTQANIRLNSFQNNTENYFLLSHFRCKQLFFFVDLHHTFIMGGYLLEQCLIPSFHLFYSLKNKLLTLGSFLPSVKILYQSTAKSLPSGS